MSIQADNTLISNREILIELVMKPLRALGHMLEQAAVRNARTQALQEIAAIPDEELRTKGLTRADLYMMAFRHDV